MKNWSLPKMLLAGVTVGLLLFALAANFIFSNNGTDVEPTANPSPTLTREGETGQLKVVASTRVWAEITELIGGEWVDVEVLVPDNQDPHSFQASARDQLAVSEAELVIANGGGYDDFMDQLIAASESELIFLKLVEGEHSHSDDPEAHPGEDTIAEIEFTNEHIWFDFNATLIAAEQIAEAIVELRPEAQSSVNAGFDFFTMEISNLEIRVEALRERALGLGFIATENVANLMLEDAGFVDLTPPDLADAVEQDREVPLAALSQAEELLKNKVAELLVVNISTTDQTTQALISAAEAGSRPIVRVSETGFIEVPGQDPELLSYLDWMAWVIDQLQEAIY